jgi:hypothetical protein
MPKIDWRGDDRFPLKLNLIYGITEWFQYRLKDPNVRLASLDKMTENDLITMARALGYRPQRRKALVIPDAEPKLAIAAPVKLIEHKN